MKKFFYRVQKGDTVISVAARFDLSPAALIGENRLDREIAEGDILFIAETDGVIYEVQPFDTFETVAEKFGVTAESLRETNPLPYLFYGLKIVVPAPLPKD